MRLAVAMPLLMTGLLVSSIAPRAAGAEAPVPPAPLARLSLEKADLRALRDRIDTLLRSEMTGIWYPRTVDPAGGFHQNLARDGSVQPETDRFLVYQARMTWTAAAFARYAPERAETFGKFARHGITYLDTVMRDREQGGFHWILGSNGKVNPRLGTEKHVYGTAFVLYAASEAYAVTREPRALAVARDAFAWLEEHAHDAQHGGYFEALTRDGSPIARRDDSKPVSQRTDRLGIYYGFKTMNSHIHLLEAVAAFYRVERTPEVKQRLEELLGIVRNRIAVDPGALNLYLTADWHAAPAHDSFGHDVETAYLLVEAAEALEFRDTEAVWRRAQQLIDHALDWGWDTEHGGFYDKGDVFGHRPYDTTKVWWTQAEGLNALLLMHTKYRGETDRYGQAFLKQWSFIERHQIDREFGGWYMDVTREGKLMGDGRKATPWKANYHTGRALMNVVKMLDTLLAEG
ncbi:MAG: AGE family epimerase/isomerase [Isosphaeraceae bacterium]